MINIDNESGWTAIIAITGILTFIWYLIFHISPKIYNHILGRKLKLYIDKQTKFTHKYGSSRLISKNINLKNIGFKMITISRILCIIKSEDGEIQILDSDMPEIILEPTELYSSEITFYDIFSTYNTSKKDKLDNSRNKLYENLMENMKERDNDKRYKNMIPEERPDIIADELQLSEFMTCVNDSKKYIDGDNNIIFVVFELEESEKYLEIKGFKKSLTPQNIEEIYRNINDYKNGWDIIFDGSRYPSVPLYRLKSKDTKETKKLYEKIKNEVLIQISTYDKI